MKVANCWLMFLANYGKRPPFDKKVLGYGQLFYVQTLLIERI